MPSEKNLRVLSILALLCGFLFVGPGCGGTSETPADGGIDASMGSDDGGPPDDLRRGGDGGVFPTPIPFKQLCSTAGFCWLNPLPQGNDLHGIWGSSPNDVWAVGDHGTILHWDGALWDRVASPVVTDLYGIAGTSASDIWAIGELGVLLRWDGVAWSKQTSPTTGLCRAIWFDGKGDGWIVGQNLMLRWRGGVWTVPPGLPTGLNDYGSIWGSSASDVWVGANPGGLFHWDGVIWTKHPLSGSSGTQVRSIAGFGANDVWVVVNSDLYHLHDGKSDPVGFDMPETRVQAVFGSGPKDVWATYYVGGDGTHFGRHHFDGKTWDTGDVERFFYPTRGFSPRAGQTWVVGSRGYMARADGNGDWTRVGAGKGAQLNGVYASAANEAFVVSNHADDPVWHFDGTAWSYPRIGVNIEMDAVTGSAANHIWIAGRATFLWDGSKWTAKSGGGDYASLWASGDDTWALFSRKLHHFSGMTWGAIEDGRVHISLSGSGSDNIWTFVTNGASEYLPFRWDGTTWVAMPVLRGVSLPELYVVGSKDVWAAGTNGSVGHWDGTAWSVTSLEANEAFSHSICGANGEVFYAHGGNTFVRRSGRWTQVETGTSQSGRSIHCRDGAVWLAGDGGMVLKKN